MNLIKVWEELTSGNFGQNKVWLEEVIIATNATKGKGTKEDPIRRITQVFTKKGSLIAEYDPHLDKNKPPIG